MTQAPPTYDRYLADFELVRQGPPEEPDWLRNLREKAIAYFRREGLPTARKGNEPWKYTNIAPIANTVFAYAPPTGGAVGFNLPSVVPSHKSWPTLVFLNGRYSPDLSSGDFGGAAVLNFGEALTSHEDILREHLARHTPYDYDGFTALNTAFLREGAFVYVPANTTVRAPLHIIFVTTHGDNPVVVYPRMLIVAGRNSKATVIETYVSADGGRYLNDAVSEIALEEGAHLEHYRLLLDGHESFHVGVSRVHQDRDSSFTSMAFAAGPSIGRNDFSSQLDAPGAECYLSGLYVTHGHQHIDNYLNIDHAKPYGTSRLYYRGILDDQSRAVFGGRVLVRAGAVKTDSHQEDKNLLLSPKAEVDSKPSLEIYADDVRCGHGATVGAVAEDALFYMRSRGLDLQTATALLIRGFASEILGKIQLTPLRAPLERLVLKALPSLQFRETS